MSTQSRGPLHAAARRRHTSSGRSFFAVLSASALVLSGASGAAMADDVTTGAPEQESATTVTTGSQDAADPTPSTTADTDGVEDPASDTQESQVPEPEVSSSPSPSATDSGSAANSLRSAARPSTGLLAAESSTTGSTLVDNPFGGTSVSDTRWQALNDACLTAAPADSTATPAGVLGKCTKTLNVTDSSGSLLQGQTKGLLQLTDASNFAKGAVLFDRAIPSSAGLDIEFDTYQYGGNKADGISFFLTDGSATLGKLGGDGGSLGYASQKDTSRSDESSRFQDGIPMGVLGVGLDAFGNFAQQNKSGGFAVGVGCEPYYERQSDSVVLRGSGNGQTGYCILGESARVKVGNSQYPSVRTSAPNTDRTNGLHVRITVSPTTDKNPTPTISVWIGGNQVIDEVSLGKNLPETVKMGFAASTGSYNDVHLIGGLRVKSINTLGAINLVKTVDSADKDKVFTVGDEVHYRFTITNPGEETLTHVRLVDPDVTGLKCTKGSTSVNLSKDGVELPGHDSIDCTGLHTVTEADVKNAVFTNTATATGLDNNQKEQKSTSSVSVPVYATSTITVKKVLNQDPSDAKIGGLPSTYTVNYSYPAGKYHYCPSNGETVNSKVPSGATFLAGGGTLTLTANGDAVTSKKIPVGAVVTFTEDALTGGPNYTWAGPVWSSGSTVTVKCGTQSLTVTNTAKLTNAPVTWTKVDTNNQRLAGSVWKLVDSNDGAVEGFANIEDCAQESCTGLDKDPAVGSFKLENVPVGTYKLTEVKAPAGYKLLTDPVRFTVNTAAGVQLGLIRNEQVDAPTLPLTGGLGTDTFLLVGGGLLALSGIGGWIHRRRALRLRRV